MAEKVIDRNERIELIVDRSEELSRPSHSHRPSTQLTPPCLSPTRSSYSFRRSSTTLKRAMMCKNLQTTLTIAAVLLVVLIFVLISFCGWSLNKC